MCFSVLNCIGLIFSSVRNMFFFRRCAPGLIVMVFGLGSFLQTAIIEYPDIFIKGRGGGGGSKIF